MKIVEEKKTWSGNQIPGMQTQLTNARWKINGKIISECNNHTANLLGMAIRAKQLDMPIPTPPIGLNKTHNYKFKNQ